MAIAGDAGLNFSPGIDFYDHVLKIFYRDGVAETVITPNTLLKDVISNADETRVSGKQIYFPTHIGRAYAYSAIGELGSLPGAKAQKYDNFTFFVRFLYTRVKVSGIVDHAAKDPGSYLAAWDSEMKGAALDFQRQRQRIYWNDGSGRLCEEAGTTNATTHTVRIHGGVPNSGTCPSAPTLHLRVGMRVAAIDDPTGAPVVIGVRNITSVDSANTFTHDGAALSLTAGDAWVIASTDSASTLKDTCFKNEPMGVTGILTEGNPLHDTNMQGVDATAAVNSWNRANLLANGGVARAITSTLMDEAWERAMEIADVPVVKAYTTFKLRRVIANLLKLDRRFDVAPGEGAPAFDGGHGAIRWNGTTIKADRDAYGGRIYLPYTPDLRLYTMGGPDWMSGDGSVKNRVPDQDAYEATLFLYETMGFDVRDKHTLLLDLLEV